MVGSRVTHKDKVFLNALRFKGELFQAGKEQSSLAFRAVADHVVPPYR